MKLILFVIHSLLILNKLFLINGLPSIICPSSIELRDTSNPTTVVGNGTLSSCNEINLAIALNHGGIITFNCGLNGQSVTIDIHNQLDISNTTDTIIDGNDIITLNGLGLTRILKFNRNDFRYSTPMLTVQRLRFINGYCQDLDGGCAIFQSLGGSTIVMNSIFENNTGPIIGQDVAGGAIWTIGGGTTIIIRSIFLENKCSNGGGLGILRSGLIIINSHFEGNQATGNGGNPGNGGNGGAISFDGWISSIDIIVCTPGRLVEHISRTLGFSLIHLRYLVIDEADRIIDEFKQDWLNILDNAVGLSSHLKNDFQPYMLNQSSSLNRKIYQKLLFSATLTHNPEILQQLNLFRPILFSSLSTSKSITMPSTLHENFIVCSITYKPLIIAYLIQNQLHSERIMIFVHSKKDVDRLSSLLKLLLPNDIKVNHISRKLTSKKIQTRLNMFEHGQIQILVCSDVLA
ncbi:unnamed protein product [Rotaria sp. Silwood1]|nr:unnamed protein product [Rotaria sp. Silwood1]